MIIEYFTITLPYQDPQVVQVRRWGGNVSRCGIKDRFGRMIWFDGEMVGFGVTVYRTHTPPPRVKLVIQGEYDKALWTSFDGTVHSVYIEKVTHEI